MALDYSGVADRYFVPRTTSAINQLMRCWTRPWSPRSRDQPRRRARRVVTNSGGGGWRVRCDEAWGEGNGTDDWPAMHGAYCTGHRHRHRSGMSNKTPSPTELQIPATVTTLISTTVAPKVHLQLLSFLITAVEILMFW